MLGFNMMSDIGFDFWLVFTREATPPSNLIFNHVSIKLIICWEKRNYKSFICDDFYDDEHLKLFWLYKLCHINHNYTAKTCAWLQYDSSHYLHSYIGSHNICIPRDRVSSSSSDCPNLQLFVIPMMMHSQGSFGWTLFGAQLTIIGDWDMLWFNVFQNICSTLRLVFTRKTLPHPILISNHVALKVYIYKNTFLLLMKSVTMNIQSIFSGTNFFTILARVMSWFTMLRFPVSFDIIIRPACIITFETSKTAISIDLKNGPI